jgi:hypothetical protein
MKQKTVRELRESLNHFVPDAFYDTEPQDADAGTEKAISLWMDTSFADDLKTQGLARPERVQSNEEGQGSLEEVFEFGAEVDAELTKAALGGSGAEQIRQSVLVKGIEALAFYVPLHVRGSQWGIYVPISSVLYLGMLFSKDTQADWNTCLKLAFRCLHQHELFHFATDYFTTQLELLMNEPCYKPARHLRDTDLGYILLEEKCANTQMLRALERPPVTLRVPHRMRALRKFVSLQPKGYRDSLQVKSREDFESNCNDLAIGYIDSIIAQTEGIDAINYMALYPLWPDIDWQLCAVHIIHDEHRLDLPILDILRFANISAISETDRFEKEYLALPKAIRTKWEKAKRQLQHSTALSGLDFKLWERRDGEPIYSVRLSKSHRAHIRYNRDEKAWYADSVGDHKQMGHG